MLQNYYYRLAEKNSYVGLEKYFKTGIKPKFETAIQGAFEKNNFTKIIKQRIIKAHYDGISQSTSHAYSQDFSPVINYFNEKPTHSFMGLLGFWHTMNFGLEAILWMYYVNFPMLLQPKNLLNKFWYNPLLGVFVDVNRSHILKNALS